MNKPMCKVCGTAHWSADGHFWPGGDGTAVDRRHPSLRGEVAPDRLAKRADGHSWPGPCPECAVLRAKLAMFEADAIAAQRRRESNKERMKAKRTEHD